MSLNYSFSFKISKFSHLFEHDRISVKSVFLQKCRNYCKNLYSLYFQKKVVFT
ncbi:hypothetical protein LEP1GSC013_0056 [Leptospira interrogans serovar Valbuzzi str. Duyster]|nr:hypothetical protein LEP1GSC013_0056 [Leptospira interrogans serovar Valbuzzi str. Duyster]ENO71896.1 hypothetical protein LEP1GSC012_2105 [Leptospira interrogans serovar Valbuzzi str. Valbuzzi]